MESYLQHRSVSARDTLRRRVGRPRRILPMAIVCALMVWASAPHAGPPEGAAAQAPALEGYRLLETWTTRAPEGIPEFGTPAGLDVAPDGVVHVADSARRTVHRLASDGRLIDAVDSAPGDDRPIDVASTGDRIFVISVNDGEVRSSDGNRVSTWSSDGMTGIAVAPDRRVYVARLAPGTFGLQPVIDIRDANGALLETWRDDRTFIQQSCGIDVGADGRVILAADGAAYVWRDGQIRQQLRVRREIEGNLLTDVALDAEGRVFAVQGTSSTACSGGTADRRRLVRWDPPAEPEDVQTSDTDRELDGAVALAVGPDAGLVVAIVDGTGFRGIGRLVDRSDLDGTVERWGVIDESLGVLEGPQRVAVTGNGDVLIADRQDLIQRWTPEGRPVQNWSGRLLGDVAALDEQPCVIGDLAITCFDAGGDIRWTRPLADDAWAAAIDGTEDRLAMVDLGRQQLELRDESGAPAGGWALPSDAGFAVFSDVAIDDGRVYLADRSKGVVHVTTLDGVVAQPPIDVPFPAVRLSARDGALFALTSNGWLLKMADDGAPRAAWRAEGDGLPSDVAAGPDGRLYVSDPRRDRVLVYGPGGTAEVPFPEAPDLRCTVDVDKRAAPDSVRVGEAVDVTLEVAGDCPEGDGRLDVALVVDTSGSMQPKDIAAAQSAVVSFLGEVKPGAAQVALISFDSTARSVAPLSPDLANIVRGVRDLSAGGMTRIDLALQMALDQLTGPAARDDVPRVVVLMTDGQPTTNDEGPTRTAARTLHRAGITVYSIGLGDGIDSGLLRELASSPENYFEAESALDLVTVYDEVGRLISATDLLRSANIIDELPEDMRFVEGSAGPDATWNAVDRTLTWSLSDVPTSGRELTYRVRPTRTGRRPTNVRAHIDWQDVRDNRGEETFPIPEVEVRSSLVLLPFVSRNVCRPQQADVVLLFDNSSSMRGPARAGSNESKLDAALRAGRVFLDEMRFPQDQAAVITFDRNVDLVQRLTGVRGALEFSLGQITTGRGTRIDLGLAAAFNELISSRHKSGNERVIILLTDGAPSPGTEVAVLQRAREARAAGIAVFTVALGADAQLVLLSVVANDPARAFRAPSAEQLQGIYRQIAGSVLCE